MNDAYSLRRAPALRHARVPEEPTTLPAVLGPPEPSPDLELHAAEARTALERELDRYQALAEWVRPNIKATIPRRIPLLDVTCRLKSLDSFEHKAAKPDLEDPGNPSVPRAD